MKERASIISTIVNVFLSASKFGVGFLVGSVTLIADGLHSGLDVLSSIITYIGIKVAGKESDEKHPYGFKITETLASLGVVILLVASAIWIGWEGVVKIFEPDFIEFTYWGYVVVIISIIANEVMARYKFKVGREENSLALVADGQHSRADVVSSVGVLLGLVVIDFAPVADGVIALLIALYILYESWGLGKETIDQLIGVSDEDAEEEIKNIAKEKEVELSDLKTKKIGSSGFAELTVKLDPDVKVEEAHKITENLQKQVFEKVPRLDHVVVQVSSHDYRQGVIKPQWGRAIKWRGRMKVKEELGINPKKGFRIMIPLNKEGEFYEDFGAPKYLLLDKDEYDAEVSRQIINNPYFETKAAGRGVKIAKAAQVDEVVVSEIGEGAIENARKEDISVKKVSRGSSVSELV